MFQASDVPDAAFPVPASFFDECSSNIARTKGEATASGVIFKDQIHSEVQKIGGTCQYAPEPGRLP